MAALVSEYTLEFFTLLNARGKKELIEWCMKEGLIASSYECPKCNEQMGLNERISVVLDGFEWRCRKKERNSPCDFDLITKIKEHKKIATQENITNVVRQQANQFTHATANANGVQCLPHRWQRVATVAGDYIADL
ncbi:uncharacterized protein TNCV_4357161 [Trichonephila clavipes]|nr:uncharacterized protein TNCV_4357161 [Trichonephila clavipes]